MIARYLSGLTQKTGDQKMEKFNANQYQRLITGVATFKRIIAPLNKSDREVVTASPLEYRAALKAAAAVSNCHCPLLALVIFGCTLKGTTTCKLGHYGQSGTVEGRSTGPRFEAYAKPADLVAATCGSCPLSETTATDITTALFN